MLTNKNNCLHYILTYSSFWYRTSPPSKLALTTWHHFQSSAASNKKVIVNCHAVPSITKQQEYSMEKGTNVNIRIPWLALMPWNPGRSCAVYRGSKSIKTNPILDPANSINPIIFLLIFKCQYTKVWPFDQRWIKS